MKKFVKIKDEAQFVRDTDSNAILNSNVGALQKYKAAREAVKQQNDKLSEIDQIKDEVNSIKQMLQLLLDKVEGK